MTFRIVSHLKHHLQAYLIALIGFLGSLSLFYALQIQEERHILSIAQLGIETIDNNIRSELAFDAHILKHVTDLASRGNLAKMPQRGNLIDLMQSYPRFYGLAETDQTAQFHWSIFPNKSLLNEPLLLQLLKGQAYPFKASPTLWISAPMALPGQKSAFLMVYSLKNGTDEKTTHFIALIDSSTLYSHATKIPGMIFELYINHQPLNPSEESSNNQPWLFEISEKRDGALWEIKAREETFGLGMLHFISHEAPLSWITLVLGILISLLLARSVALSNLLKERTQILDKINQDLKHEVTEHIQTEESKKNLEKALLQGQKLQAIGTLAGGIAHDFNNILYAIRGYVELARDDIPRDSVTYKNLGKVLEGTYRGQDLVARILSFSRRQHHELTPLKLKTEITGALSLLRPTIPQSVDLRFAPTTEGKILGNKTQVHQVIVNLINNAVDAMDGEGTITIALNPVHTKELLPPEFSANPSQNYCKIEISDTGHGMDARTIERIFEPFFTTKEVGRGTGLGLSTVHTIVKEHNGEILVNSQLGKGTIFTLYFPEYTESHEEAKHG